MKVIITGGTGVLGTALSHRLAHDGNEVVVLSRSGRGGDKLPPSARVVQWDSKSGDGWHHELRDTDAVINLAGENIGAGRWTSSRKEKIHLSRIDAGRAIVDAVHQSGQAPLRLIQASGINYYGEREDKLLTESDPPGDGFLTDVCIDWERSTEPLDQLGTQRVVTRNAVVLARGEGALPLLALPFRLFVGGRVGSGRQGFSWIHIDDYVEAIMFLLRDNSIVGPVNLAAPEPVSNRELSSAIATALNRPNWFPVPGFMLRLVVGEFAEHLINGQFVIPERLLQAGFEFKFPTIDAALEDLLSNGR